MADVLCLSYGRPRQGKVRSLLVPSNVSTLGKVRVRPVEDVYNHTSRLRIELSVNINSHKFISMNHPVMKLVHTLGQNEHKSDCLTQLFP